MILTLRKLIGALTSILMILSVEVSISAHPVVCNNPDVIGQARDAYYNLTRQGFYGFEAALDPNWHVILGPTATKENLTVFRALRFSMTVDARGAVTITHAVISTNRTRLQPYIKQIDYNIQRLVKPILGTWAMFMVNSPFPENEFRLENWANGYHLFYTTASRDAMLTMTRDLLITEWKLTDARAKRTIKPVFQKTVDGLLLTGYQSLFEPLGEGKKTSLNINIQYQVVSGMRLPRKIQFKGVWGSEPVEAELTLQSVRATLKS